MRTYFGWATALGSLALVGLAFVPGARAAEALQSGLKPGDAPAAFTVQDCTGPAAGTSLCYRCRYGAKPVVAVFTRKLDDSVTSLVKQVDAKIDENKQMKAFVVYLTDDPDKAEPQLKAMAKKNHIKNVPLTIFDGLIGPPDYKLSKNAEVTVLMWNQSEVKVNHALEQGKLDKQSIKEIVSDTSKILN